MTEILVFITLNGLLVGSQLLRRTSRS